MDGIERSKRFWREAVEPMLDAEFADRKDRIAAGIAGEGSECFGYDDAISRDHDFLSGCWLWLTREDDSAFGLRLKRAYDALPQRGDAAEQRSMGGYERGGVCVIEDFFARLIGRETPPETAEEWLWLPDRALATAVNGAVFSDPPGLVTAFREKLAAQPEDVRKKKLAARLAVAAQAGQYNYMRCCRHGEYGAAQLALAEFATETARILFSLNRAYAPFYKWLLRAAGELPILGDLAGELEALLIRGISRTTFAETAERIDAICAAIVAELNAQGLSALSDPYLEAHAYAVTDGIRDRRIRAMHPFDCAE